MDKKMETAINGYQPRMLNEGYQPKGKKVDLKTLKPPVLKSAAFKSQTSDSEKKND